MKIILLEDDVSLGDRGKIVEVKKGYAMNFLFPSKKAIIANKSNVLMMQNMMLHQNKKIAKERELHQKDATKLNGITLEFVSKAGLSGHLYGTITTEQIVEQIKEKAGIEISRKKVALNTHIKTAGSYTARIKLFSEVNITVPIVVSVEVEEQKESGSKRKSERKTERFEERSDIE
ncbi:MAG: 50S ribosomal protein L9 [Candidatus Margulisbacteria bacterium GWF2_35_9]|nr:MAG: 50S ribosomal protein L9 [Candidatus Margulisbacteria bacterium GWF2_35_9]